MARRRGTGELCEENPHPAAHSIADSAAFSVDQPVEVKPQYCDPAIEPDAPGSLRCINDLADDLLRLTREPVHPAEVSVTARQLLELRPSDRRLLESCWSDFDRGTKKHDPELLAHAVQVAEQLLRMVSKNQRCVARSIPISEQDE